jgi:hypothetical protein
MALSGSAQPPKVLKTERVVIAFVAENTNAIGFVLLRHLESANEISEQFKILTVDGKSHTEEGYILHE